MEGEPGEQRSADDETCDGLTDLHVAAAEEVAVFVVQLVGDGDVDQGEQQRAEIPRHDAEQDEKDEVKERLARGDVSAGLWHGEADVGFGVVVERVVDFLLRPAGGDEGGGDARPRLAPVQRFADEDVERLVGHVRPLAVERTLRGFGGLGQFYMPPQRSAAASPLSFASSFRRQSFVWPPMAMPWLARARTVARACCSAGASARPDQTGSTLSM